jgi:hypothetical protein
MTEIWVDGNFRSPSLSEIVTVCSPAKSLGPPLSPAKGGEVSVIASLAKEGLGSAPPESA